MASTGSATRTVGTPKSRTAPTESPAASSVNAGRHFAWLVGGIAGSFLVPFVLADQLGLQRDPYYALYVAAVVGLFVGWARDTHLSKLAVVPSLRESARSRGSSYAR